MVMLSDILPTGFECGVLNGQLKPGDTFAIVGAGPIGLAALLTAQFYSPAEVVMIDVDENRLQVARSFGGTKAVNSSDGELQLKKLVTHRFGLADVMKAYDTFGNAAKERALKVILQGAWQRDSA